MKPFADDIQIFAFSDFPNFDNAMFFQCSAADKSMKYGVRANTSPILIQPEDINALAAAIPSPNFTFFFDINKFVPQMLTICDCKSVYVH
jgi:hypothetical protein